MLLLEIGIRGQRQDSRNKDVITKITISSGIDISDTAFQNLSSLEEVNFKNTNGLSHIGEDVFPSGIAEFDFTHASYYAVTFSSAPLYEDVSAAAGTQSDSSPIDSTAPVTNGVTVPTAKLPRVPNFSNKKRRYIVLRKRRLEDMVFVF